MSELQATLPPITVADLASLIDVRRKVVAEIKALEAQKDALGEQIIAAMRDDQLNEAFGESGGYRLQEKLECNYTEKAYKYAVRQGIIDLFTPAPKITRAKVMEALKKNRLSQVQFNRLQKAAGPIQSAFTLVGLDKAKEAPDAV